MKRFYSSIPLIKPSNITSTAPPPPKKKKKKKKKMKDLVSVYLEITKNSLEKCAKPGSKMREV